MHKSELEYTGFGIRFGAFLIDLLIIAIIIYPLLGMIYGKAYFAEDAPFIRGPLDFLISWVAPAIAIIMCWLFFQATPGKMIVGARIVDANTGAPASVGQYTGRYFSYFLSMLPLALGCLWIAVDPKRQGWHDKLAGTVVVQSKKRPPEPVQFGDKNWSIDDN